MPTAWPQYGELSVIEGMLMERIFLAILEGNLEAVYLFSRVRRLGKAPNLGLVKFAVLEGGCDRSIVFELITAGRLWGHRRWEDVELDAW
jgi:hypothetical protein